VLGLGAGEHPDALGGEDLGDQGRGLGLVGREQPGPCCTIVTRTPNRENTWASSQPIGPPPSTTSEPGSSVTRTASRFVQYGVPASPSIGGTAGRVPGLSSTPRVAAYVVVVPPGSSTRTRPGPSRRPTPWWKTAPASRSRSTAIESSHPVVASSSMRRATTDHAGAIVASPATAAARRTSATTSLPRTIILVGMQP